MTNNLSQFVTIILPLSKLLFILGKRRDFMNFHEKLSILMDISKTTNRDLAMYSSLDSSHISRLRNGSRKPVKDASYLMTFAQFLSKRLSSLGKEEMIKRLLCLDSNLSFDNEMLSRTIYHWLTKDSSSNTNFKQDLLRGTPGVGNHIFSCDGVRQEAEQDQLNNSSCSVYYGIEGKRLAALNFLNCILNSNGKHTILLFSDEDMTWMTGDPNFILQWAQSMKSILMKGNRIIVIHDLSRSLDEILSSIKYWIPLYMTGAIDPFYYPRKRDGIYKKSLFIAPGVCAVTSSSIGGILNSPNESANFLFRDNNVINALQKEFENYLSLCRPLMEIFRAKDNTAYFPLLAAFENQHGATIYKTKHLSSISMPVTVLESIIKDNPLPVREQILAFNKMRSENFKRNLNQNTVMEIFSIPSLDLIRQGKAKIDLSNTLDAGELYYTEEYYRMHLENVLMLLKQYDNYHVCIEKTEHDLGYSLCAKENSGIIVTNNTPPVAILSIRENNLVAGFWDFLLDLYKKNEVSKKTTISILKSTINELT